MRVLHSISRSDDTASLALVCGMRDAGVDCVVLALAGSPAAVLATSLHLPTIAFEGPACPGGNDASGVLDFIDADLVHVHGAPSRPVGAASPDWPHTGIFASRAGLLTLSERDLDHEGLPAERTCISEDAPCAVLLPANASRDEALVWSRLPANVRAIAWSSRLPITQCAGLYGTLMSRVAPRRPAKPEIAVAEP